MQWLRSIFPKGMRIINLYVPNIMALKNEKQILYLKGKINSDTIIVGDFNTPLSTTDKQSRQIISEKTLDLNIRGRRYQTDMHSAFCPTHSSQAHGTFSGIDCRQGYKTSLSKLKKVAITSIIFSNHNDMKLYRYSRRKVGKFKYVEIK